MTMTPAQSRVKLTQPVNVKQTYLDCGADLKFYLDSDASEKEEPSPCHLCGDDLWPHDEWDYDDPFTVFTSWNMFNGLRCVYCFKTFCREPCSFSLSGWSYKQKLLQRSWACPSCVPSFEPANCSESDYDNEMGSQLLLEFVLTVFSMLYHLYNFLSSGGPCFGLIEFLFVILFFRRTLCMIWSDIT